MKLTRRIFAALVLAASLFPFCSYAGFSYYMAALPEASAEKAAADQVTLDRALSSRTDALSLGEEWQGVDWLITRYFERTGKKIKVVLGGKEIGAKGPHGRPRIYYSADVKVLADQLNGIDPLKVIELYDPEAMDADSVYPMDWSENAPELRSGLIRRLTDLKTFITRAARSNNAIIYSWY